MQLKDLDFTALEASLQHQFSLVSSAPDLEVFRRDWLGKEGTIKVLFKQLRDIEPERKAEYAAQLNSIKERIEGFVATREVELRADKVKVALSAERLDLSLPAIFPGLGRTHPVTKIERRIAEILRPFGFENVQGPEIEKEYYCFDSLNILPHHPARDMQDTFYTENQHVLRTHTTSVQARVLEESGKRQGGRLPVKVASFGRTYRNETEDASHQAMFHQFELVWVDKGLTLSNLMALISHILRELYGKKRKIHFVPKYYPYTEPSLGPQIDCTICKGGGCPACGGAGWVTVGGSGMVHRKVLEEFAYDPSVVSGFAFGLGTSRLAAQTIQVPKLKMIYENDLRILKNV
ncbi:MAG: phenylalanine--tRNA ligase subunit alpha [Deltaproteobacteria bacterium]|nr:phenylalanine--tRNA ligase subunit alpha [Deltaproteobacteria bacterium]